LAQAPGQYEKNIPDCSCCTDDRY